jgi:programmed cell death protein 5
MVSTQDNELNQLREQRRMALQQQFEQQAAHQADAEVQAQEAQRVSQNLDASMKTLLTPEARSRISTIALATPERAEMIKQSIVQLHSQGKLNAVMNDEQLKQLLQSQSKSRRSASIRRI